MSAKYRNIFLISITLSYLASGNVFGTTDHANIYEDSSLFKLFQDPSHSHRRRDKAFAQFGTLHTLESLAKAANNEETFYRILTRRRKIVQREIDLITRYIADYEETFQQAFAGVNGPFEKVRVKDRLDGSNFALVHRIKQRYATLLADLRKLLGSQSYKFVTTNVKHTLQIHYGSSYQQRWPQLEDLLISHVAIFDMQDFYNLDPDMMYQGVTYDSNFGGALNSSHLTLLGTVALRMGHYLKAVTWLEFTQEFMKISNMGREDLPSSDLVRRLVLLVLQEHNHQFQANLKNGFPDFTNLCHFYVQPVFFGESWDSPSRWPFHIAVIQHEGRKYGNTSTSDPAYMNMFPLCMGEDLQPEEIKSRLYCYLDKQRHPYFILNPLKTEQLSEYPFIVQFYDIIGPQTIKEMHQVRGELQFSKVHGAPVEASVGVRTSAGSLPSMDYVYKIQNKSEMLTGLLLTDFAEKIQTAEYTYGKMYKTHRDPGALPGRPINSSSKIGERLATLLYYMDEPVEGGSTFFGEVGITTRAVSGSAVFWVNLYKNGTVRSDVSHGACPVLYGHKTIINQWFRYNSNFQTFKCALNQFD